MNKRILLLSLVLCMGIAIYLTLRPSSVKSTSLTVVKAPAAKVPAVEVVSTTAKMGPQVGATSDKESVRSESFAPTKPAAPAIADRRVELQKHLQPFRESAIEEGNNAMFLALKWSPAQREAFKQLAVYRLEKGDRLLAHLDFRDPLTSQVMQEQLTSEFLSELRSAIGDRAVEQYQNYENTKPARNLTSQLASMLIFSESPITPDQANELVTILAANSSNASGQVDWKHANVEAIVSQAQKALSPLQVEQLSKILSIITAHQDPTKSKSGFSLKK